MNTCPFRTESCGLSCPCAKCRGVSSQAAHVLVRFDAQGRHRGRFSKEESARYEGRRGGYWQRQGAYGWA